MVQTLEVELLCSFGLYMRMATADFLRNIGIFADTATPILELATVGYRYNFYIFCSIDIVGNNNAFRY